MECLGSLPDLRAHMAALLCVPLDCGTDEK
eukprot:SAG11_NODE_2847_length_2910_cov_2.145500_1_plen_29_part_10